jgi:CspA family cold shock protein
MTIIAKGAGLTPLCDARGAGHVGAGAVFEFGVVRFFNVGKGYGFLTRDGNGGDVFLHARALPLGTVPREGDRVRFVLQRQPDGRFRAASATVVGAVG